MVNMDIQKIKLLCNSCDEEFEIDKHNYVCHKCRNSDN
jgi:Zn finger protein HypA/HybF involved in hydrogenase expression